MPKQFSEGVSSLLLRYYFGPDHLAKLRLWSVVMALLGKPRFVCRYNKKALLSLDMNDFIQNEIIQHGAYEPEVWDALAKSVTADEVFWDVGAHIGTVGIRAAVDERVASVHLFEPNPRTFGYLTENVRLNPSLKLTAHPIALSDEDGMKPLFFGLEGNQGLSALLPNFTNRSVEVQVLKGDSVIERGMAKAPTLIKFDVERNEYRAIKGLEKTLRRSPPKAIVFEAEIGVGKRDADDIVELLATFGYQSTQFKYPQERNTVNFLAVLRS